MCQSLNPVDVIANVATGGLYGAAQGAAQGRPLQALATPGPFGSVVQPTLGTGPALQGELIGAGAGLGGGGLGALKPTGFGAAGAPMVGPEGIPILTDAAGNAAMSVDAAGNPIAGGGIPASAIAGGYGGAAFTGGAGASNALLGAGAAQMGGNLGSSFLGAGGTGLQPLSIPQGGAVPGKVSNAQLSAIASQPHQGLAPWFRIKQGGGSPPGGIAEPGASGTALDTMQRYPNLLFPGR